jgi:hypothetical protein
MLGTVMVVGLGLVALFSVGLPGGTAGNVSPPRLERGTPKLPGTMLFT